MIPDSWKWYDAECPNCDGKFLWTPELNADGSRPPELQCTCGYHEVDGEDARVVPKYDTARFE